MGEVLRKFELVEIPDFFTAGVSGAGKDTVSDYIKSYYDFNKLRIAGTIKRIICEKYNISFDELEKRKRVEPELRKEHNTVGEMLGKSYLNRIELLCNRKSMDFEHIEDPYKPMIVVDVRGFDESEILFKNNAVGIYLTRSNNNEFSSAHWTDNGFFNLDGNNIFEVLLTNKNAKVIVVDNGQLFNNPEFVEKFKTLYEGKVNFELVAFNEGIVVDAQLLIDAVDDKLIELYPQIKTLEVL